MKKIFALVLALMVVLALTGCKSEAVKNVEARIDGIGAVSIGSQALIDDVMDAYEALTEEDAAKVENYAVLQAAADECLQLQLVGDWCNVPTYFYYIEEMYNTVNLSLSDRGVAEGDYMSGNWYVENGNLMIEENDALFEYSIFRENGKLRIGDYSPWMPAAEYKALLDDMFTTVELTPSNVADYFDIAMYTKYEEDAFGVQTGDYYISAILTSKVYDDGLMYFGCSDDFAVELNIPEHKYKWWNGWSWRTAKEEASTTAIEYSPFSAYGASLGSKFGEWENIPELTADQITFGRVRGSVTYINKDYVEKVDNQDGTKYLVLPGGNEHYIGEWLEGYDY